jgi:hypothetical protein
LGTKVVMTLTVDWWWCWCWCWLSLIWWTIIDSKHDQE